MKIHEFQDELWLPAPLEEVFPFFADARNLEEITPPWLSFQVLTPEPTTMREGLKLDYKLRVHGFPLRWQSLIKAWEPPHRFVDEALRSPYRKWHHEHRFEAKDGGTLCRDHVHYAVPFDFLSHRFFVRPDVERIFAYRRKKLLERFGSRPE